MEGQMGRYKMEQQQEHLHRLIERFAERTRRSKQIAQQTRSHHADNRGTAGFNLTFKEIVYPLAVEHAQGSHIVDVDGNEYVDITMGFGAFLYGHSPDFVVNAILSLSVFFRYSDTQILRSSTISTVLVKENSSEINSHR
jgi:4-aminobutyrate aminotransferase-like enzyme